MSQTRSRLVRAMGLSPAALVAALSGCGVEPAEVDLDDDAFAQQLATAHDGVQQVAPPGDLTLNVRGVLEAGVTNAAIVSGADPFTRVFLIASDIPGAGPCPPALNGVCVDVVAPIVLGSAVADGSGVARLGFALPYDIDEGTTWYLQAAGPGAGVGDTSNVWFEDVLYPPRDCGDFPWLDGSTTAFGTYLACVPRPGSGTCPDYSNLPPEPAAPWMSKLYRRATGQVPDFGQFSTWESCNELSVDNACCYQMEITPPIVIGRPFRVDGEMRVPSTSATSAWCRDGAPDFSHLNRRARRRLSCAWLRAAQAEHASVAAFARFVLQLLALGAPAELVAAASAAMGDEVEHARDAFQIASAFAGQPLGAGPLDTTDSLEDCDLESILMDVVREGCITETIAATQAAVARDACQDPAIRAVLAKVADDETRHAELAWQFAHWALQQRPDLTEKVRAVFMEGLVQERVAADPLEATLAHYGVLSEPALQGVARRVYSDVIYPCASALVGVPTGLGLAA